ncbi:MAG: MFS transporter [Rickettsiaceae bacterium]|nr:MFS transporter [Rickettsiaceae bacterium]
MLISMGINATGSLLFYMEAIYLTSYMRINRGFSEVYIDNLTNFCYIIMAIFTLLTGWLSDKIGRRKIFVINLTAIIVFSPILLQILENGNYLTVILAQIIIAIMAASYIGPEPTLQAELYPTNLRNTCLSISYNTAASIFGGTAPYIIEYLVQNTGHLTSSIYYIIFCSLLSLVALYFYKDRSIADYKVIIDDE